MKTFTYQNKRSVNYFEGWYFRVTDDQKNINLAFIFAITKTTLNPHSFIQYYNETEQKAHYYSFDIEQFSYDEDTQTVRIGENYITPRSVFIQTDDISFEATVPKYDLLQSYQGTTSAMGFLSHAPLECFQEVLYMKGAVSFLCNGTTYQGTSYLEKTYGTNFPKQWIWLQSNHSDNGSSISFSVGKVPFLWFYVKGFFLIYTANGKEHRYGSFNFSRISVKQHSETVDITIKKGRTKITIQAKTPTPITLVGPRKKGIMDLEVYESIAAVATMKVYKKGILVFEDTYHHVGLELMYKNKADN